MKGIFVIGYEHSKLYFHFKKMNDTPVISLQEIFTSKNFNKCLNVTQTMWPEALSPLVKLGQYIRDILVLIKKVTIITSDADRVKDCDDFDFLLETIYSYMINCPNLRKLKEKKDKVVEMPVTKDIIVFLKYLVEVKSLVNEIKADQNSNLWYQLA